MPIDSLSCQRDLMVGPFSLPAKRSYMIACHVKRDDNLPSQRE